ncbi:MAG TPA: energy transducer TonB [Pseudomonadales bacterium]|nr:energy transducer TonB [Pseudomonadales bacterium]
MAARIPFTRLGPFAASCALHVVLVGLAAAVVPGWVTPLPSVLEAQLIEPEPVPVTPAPPAARPARPTQPAPTTQPRLAEAPKPRVEEPQAMESPSLPAPAPSVAPPSPPSAPREALPFAVAASEPAATPAELPAAVGRPAPPAAAPVSPLAVAKAPPDEGPTRLATPSGGYQVRPSYPSSARRLGVEGTTLLRVYVAADGRVTDVQVDQSAGHPDLDRAAAEAVRRWKFEPGRRGSEPVGMWVRLPVQFVLK